MIAENDLHPLGDFAQLVQQRLQALRPQIQFLHQPHGPIAAAHQATPGLVPFGKRRTAANGDAEIDAVETQQMCQRFQVRGQPPQDALLHRRVGHRNFDRAIEPQCAVAHLFQQGRRALQHEIAGQHVVAESAASIFDALCRFDFFVPREQRNLAHLHQVHPHRVVDLIARTWLRVPPPPHRPPPFPHRAGFVWGAWSGASRSVGFQTGPFFTPFFFSGGGFVRLV